MSERPDPEPGPTAATGHAQAPASGRGLVVAGMLALFAGSSFLTAFRSEDLYRPVLLAAVLGTLASGLLTGAARRGPSAAVLGGLALLTGGGVLIGSFAAEGLKDGAPTVWQAPAPVPATAAELTVPYVAVGLAALFGAEVAQRSRAAASPVLPSLLLLVLGLVLGGDGQELPLAGPFAWTAGALVLIGWRSRSVDSSPVTGSLRQRLVSFGALGATLVTVAGLLAVGPGALAHEVLEDQELDRFRIEDREDPDDATGDAAFNPLTRVTALHDGPDEALFEVETSAPVEGWRLAVLDSYDGESWTSDQSFVPAGDELPPLPPASAPDPEALDGEPTELDQVVQATEQGRQHLGLRLPVAGRPLEVDIDGLLFHNESGTLAADGTVPDSYSVTSEVAWPDRGPLAEDDAADDAEARAALELPEEVPEEIETLASELTDGVDSAYGRAVALEGYFASFALAFEEPPSGHSFGHLSHFLFTSQLGSPEQFAASYALLARASDLPSRVVVGFNGLGAAGEHTITSYAATAWVEVKFSDAGWVAFHPVPALAPEIAPTSDEDDVAGSDEELALEDQEDAGDDESDDDAEVGAGGDEDDETGASQLPLIAGGVLALAILVGAAPAVRRAVRRRRQQQGSTVARISGAWDATLDVLRTAGLPVGDDLGALDVVGVGQQRLPGESLGALGSLVNHALFAPDPLGDAAASRAWELRDEIARDYRRSRSRGQAVRDYFTGR